MHLCISRTLTPARPVKTVEAKVEGTDPPDQARTRAGLLLTCPVGVTCSAGHCSWFRLSTWLSLGTARFSLILKSLRSVFRLRACKEMLIFAEAKYN